MYITLDGPEATGKSTAAKSLSDRLGKSGHNVFLTKEPGSPHDPVCMAIRKILLNPSHAIADRAAVLLFLADRAQHIERVTEALSGGAVVVSDRSSLSTYVYHTAKERDFVSESDDVGICAMIDFAQQVKPDVGFIFNSELEWSLDKMRSRKSLDRIELFDESFHARTHTLFEEYNVARASAMLLKSPAEIVYVPATSGHTECEISDFLFERVMLHLERE